MTTKKKKAKRAPATKDAPTATTKRAVRKKPRKRRSKPKAASAPAPTSRPDRAFGNRRR